MGRLFSRRRAIRLAGLALVAPFALLVRSLTGRVAALEPRSREVVVTLGTGPDTIFAEGAIVTRAGSHLRVLSARCTHLGCLIAREADGLLVCPCHGSRFRPDGSVAAGPAARPLQPLQYRLDRATGTLTVEVT